jgi:hypothetical protein
MDILINVSNIMHAVKSTFEIVTALERLNNLTHDFFVCKGNNVKPVLGEKELSIVLC